MSAHFDGNDGFSFPAVTIPDGPWTMVLKSYGTAASEAIGFGFDDNAGGARDAVVVRTVSNTGNYAAFAVLAGSTPVDIGDVPIVQKAWRYQVITYDGVTTMKNYVDGVQSGADMVVGNPGAIVTANGRIGCFNNGGADSIFHNGWLKDAAIINELWTAQQIADFQADVALDTISAIADIEVWYELDDLTDTTGNYGDLSISSGDPSFSEPFSTLGEAIFFDGSNDRLDFPDIPIAGDFTMFGRAYIVSHPGAVFATLWGGDNSPTSPRELVSFNSKEPTGESVGNCWINGDDAIFNPSTLLSTGAWHDIVITRAGTVAKCFVDDSAFGATDVTGTGSLTLENLSIGGYRRTNQYFVNCYVAQWGIANEAWSGAQITAFSAGDAPDVVSDIANLEVYYPLNGTLLDKTGNYSQPARVDNPTFGSPLPTAGMPTSTVNVAEIYKTVSTSTLPVMLNEQEGPNERQAYIDTSGRMWFAYGKQDAANNWYDTVNVSFSDDDGATWTEEEIDDSATIGTGAPDEWSAFFGEANNGEMVLCLSGNFTSGNDRIKVYRRIAGTWTEVADFSGDTGVIETMHAGGAIYNHPDDDLVWMIVGGGHDSGVSQTGPTYYLTQDDWTSVTIDTFESSNSSRSNALTAAHGICILRSTDRRTVYFFYHSTVASAGRLRLATITAWDTTLARHTLTLDTGAVSTEMQWVKAWWSAADEISVYYNRTGAQDRWYWCIDVSGTPVALNGGDTGETNAGQAVVGYLDETQGVLMSLGEASPGPTAKWEWRNPAFDYKSAKLDITISGSSLENAMPFGFNVTADFGFVTGIERFGAVEGLAGIWWGRRSSNNEILYIETDNVVYGTGSEIPPVAAVDALEFTEAASLMEVFGPFLVSGANPTQQIGNGGRYLIRQSDGRLWAFHGAGSSSFRAAYSDDSGRTWTNTLVDSKNATQGIAACIDSNGFPLVVISLNKKLRQYSWNGTVWTHVGNVGTGDANTTGFQVLYDGTDHWLIYGDRASGGNRRLRARTTSDPTVLFGSATNIDTSTAGSSKGPHSARGMGAAVDGDGNIYVAYQMKQSGSNFLWYTMYNGSSWSLPIAMQIAGSGNNDIDTFQYIAVSLDADNKLHVICRRKSNGLYTNRFAIWYLTNKLSPWIALEVSGSVDENQSWPTISATADGKVHVMYRTAFSDPLEPGVYTNSDDWEALELAFESVPAMFDAPVMLSGPANVNYQRMARGWAVVFDSSLEYAESLDVLFDDQANAGETLLFTEGVAVQGFPVAADELLFTEAPTSEVTKTASDLLVFTEFAGLYYDIEAADEVAFLENPNRLVGVGALDLLDFIEASEGIKRPEREAADTIEFLEGAGISRLTMAFDELEFEEEPSEVARLNIFVVDVLDFIETPSEVAELNIFASDTFEFTEGAAILPTGDPCDDYTPSPAIPTDEDDVEYVYFMAPFNTMDFVVRLKKPEYGDSRTLELQVQVQRTKSGERRTFIRTPTYEPWEMEFDSEPRERLFQIREMLLATKGQEVRFIDHNSQVWRGVIINSSIPLNTTKRDQGTNFSLTFEGDLISA
jgi:hypothetical protein